MTVERHPLLDRFVRVWMQVSKKPVPNIYKIKKTDMPITQLERMIEIDPELSQAIFSTPVDEINDGQLQQHILDNSFWMEDEQKLLEHGYYNSAKTITEAKVKYEQDKINKEIEESRKRQELQRQERERWEKMSLMERLHEESKKQTPADIINAQMRYHGHVGNV